MSVESWNGGSGGWGTVANWTGGIPNSTTADATISAAGAYVVTVEAGKSYAVDSVLVTDSSAALDVVGTLGLGGTLALMNIAAGTLELAGVVSGGNLDIQSGATLLALGGALTGEKSFYLGGSGYINLDNHALTLGGTSNLLGYVFGTGDLVISGLGTLTDNTDFQSGVTLDDTGTIVLQTGNDYGNGGTAATVLTIASTGTYDITAPNVALNNSGTFDIVNAGLFEMTGTNTPDGYVNVYNSSFSNTGTLLAVKGSDISLLQGQENLAGTITGAGDLYIGQGATATLEAGLSLNIGAITFSDGNTDILLESNRTIGSALSEINGAAISLNGHTLTTSGTGQLRGYINGPGTLNISGSFANGGLYVGSGVEELVTGTVAQDSGARLDYDNGTAASILSIANGGTYDITAVNSDIDYNGTGGTIINSGLFENVTSLAAYTSGLDYSYFNAYANFTNSSAGTIYVGTADDISLVYGTNDLAGTITGAGDLYLGSTTTLEAGLVLTNGRYLTLNGANIYLKGSRSFGENLQIQSGANLQLDGYNATLANIGTLNGYITGPGTLDVTGTYYVGGLHLSSGLTEVLSGVEIQNSESQLNYDNGTAAVLLSIASTGIYDITADSNLDDYYSNYGTIINSGLFEKTGYDNYSNIYQDFTNTSTGTILASAGDDISFIAATNDIAGTITGAGDIYFGQGGVTTLEAGAVISNSLAAFTVSDSNTQLYLESNRSFASTFTDQSSANVQLNGHTLTLAGISQFNSGYVSGAGELIITGTSDFDNFYAIGTMTVLDKGTITQDGSDELGINSTSDVVLSIASGAVYNIINDSIINPQGPSAINNAGLFEKTAAGGISDIYAPLNNLSTGTIGAAQGELRLDNGGTLNGTLTGAGEIDLNGGTFSLASAASTSIKTLAITGADLILEGSRSFSGAFVENSGTVSLHGFTLSLNNPGDYLDGFVSGPGTLSEAGRADIYDLQLTGGAVLKDTGTLTQDGYLYVSNAGGDTAAITVGSTGIYDLINDNSIYANGAGTINNSGLFEKTAGTGDSNIYPVFNNAASGTLKVAAGYVQLLGGGSLAGTLNGAGELNLTTGTFGLAAAAVVSVGTLGINGAQLNLLGSRSFTGKFIESSGDLNLNGFNATLSAADNLYNAYLTGPGTLDITGTTEEHNYYVTGGAVLQDAGTIIADGNLFLGNAATDSGTLNISTGAEFNFTNDSYIYTYGTAVVNNAGLLEKTADNGTSVIYTAINNTGTLDAARGVIDLNSGGTLGGTLEGAGTIELGGGSFALTSAAVLGVTQIDDYNAALGLQSNRAFGGIFNEYYGGGTIQLNGHTLTLSGTDSFNGYVAGAGTLVLSGTSDLNGYNLTQGALLLDTGTLTMDGAVQIGEATTDSATLSVASGGTFDILNDNYIYEDGTVAVVNSGLFEKTGSGTGRSYVQGTLDNATGGTIALTTGILELQTLVNDSRVTVSNALLQADTNVTADAGKTGTIVLGPSATLSEIAGIAASQTISFSGSNAELEIGTSGSFAGTITGFSTGDTIDVAGTVANGLHYANSKLTLTENGTVVSSLAISGITNIGSLSLVQDGNGGTDIEISNPGSITQPGTAITTDSFLIPNGQSTADFNTAADWSAGTVANALNTATYRSNNTGGTVTDSGNNTVYQFSFNDGALTFSQTAGVLNVIDGGNSGFGNFSQSAGATINDQAGELGFYTDGSVAGTLSGAGKIELGGNSGNGFTPLTIAATAVLNVASLAFQDVILDGNQTYNGAFQGVDGGYTDLNGFTLTLNGAASLSPTYSYEFDGPGELILAGSAIASQFYIHDYAAVDVTGIFTDDQNVYIGNNGLGTASLSISTTGTFDMAANSNVNADSYNNTESLTNSGLLEKTGDGGTSYIQYLNFTQASTGTLDVARGTLLMQNDSGYINGTVTGPGELELSASSITLAPTAIVNVAALAISGSNLFIAANRNYAGDFVMASGGTLELGANNLTLSGTSSLGGVYVGGSGTLLVTGQADTAGAQLENTSELLDAGTIVQDGGFALGYFGTDVTSLVINTGAVYDIVNDNAIGASGTASIYNAGLFEKTADNGDSYIYPSFTNAATGTIDVASGRLIMDGGGTLNGTIEGAGVLYLQNNNNNYTLAAGAVLTVATINTNENLVLENSRSYAGSLIDSNSLDLNGYNLTLGGSAGLDSYLEGGGTLTASQGDISGLYEYGNVFLVDKGTITQDGGYTIGNTATDSSGLSIASGAVYDLLTDNSINANGTASAINNAGLFEKTGDYGNSVIYPSFTNTSTGTISVARGFLQFQDGGTFNGTLTGGTDGTIADGGIIIGNGLFQLGSAAVVSVAELELSNGTLSLGGNRNYTGFFEGTGGSLALNGHNLTLASPYLGGFYLSGPGAVTVSGTGTLNGLGQINGSLLVDKGTIVQDGGYQIGYSATDSSELSLTSAGTFDIITDNSIGANGPAAKVLNSGLFEKTADNGYSAVQASFTNQSTGIIDVTRGDLAFTGGGVFGGTIEGAGEFQLASTADTLTSSVVTVGTLVVASSSTLGSNLTYGGDFVLNYSQTLLLESNTLALNGTASLIGAFEGPGTAIVNGDANVALADLYGGATLIDNGTINQTDELRFSLNDNTTDTLSITSSGTYNIQDDSNFHNFNGIGSAENVINAGLLEKTGDTGLSELQVTLSNTGTVLVTSGTLQIDASTNLNAAGTLAGGAWIADTGFLGPVLSIAGGSIAVDSAAITLSGANSELIAGGTLIETSLTSVSSGGILAIDGGRNFLSVNTISDAGAILLQGGTFADASLTIATGGSFTGTGTITSPVLDNGRIEATGSALTVEGAITGAGSLLIDAHSALILGAGDVSGTNITFGGTHAVLGLDAPGSVFGTLVSLAPSDTIDLVGTLVKSATIAGNQLVVSLTAGGVIDYALANQTTLSRAAVVSDGNGGSDIVIFRQAKASAISPTPVDLGEHHAGTTDSVTYTIANTATVDPYSENLNASMGATTGQITDSGSFTGLAPGATNSTALHASLVTTTGGLVSGTATVNLYTTGTGVSGDDGGTLTLPPETVSLTGTIFNYATAVVTPKPLSTGQHHVGDTISQFITIANSAAAGTFSENLDAKFSGTSSDLTGSGTISLLAAGGTNSAGLDITLHSGTAGVETGNATIGLTSDGGGIDTLANTGLTSQTVTVTGTLFNYATAKTAATINFGEHHAGTSDTAFITISNHAATGTFSEKLDVSFAGSSAGLTGTGSVTTLAAGSTSSTKLDLTLNSTAGLDTGTTTLALTSDGSGIDSLGTTALGDITIATTGTLFNYATAAVSPKPLGFGQHHVGDAISQFVTIANTAAPGAYSENLDASFSGTSSVLTETGSFTGLAAGSTNSTALAITLASGTFGVETGNATIKLTSDTAGIDTLANTGLTSQVVTVSGTLFNYATASAATPAPVNFGIVHVGSTLAEYLTFSNTAVVSKYSENLDASFTGTSSNITASGTLSELLAGSTSKATMKLKLNTGAAGTIDGTTTLALTSDGKGIDSLGTTALAGQVITVIGTVNNYATTVVEAIAGNGTLTGSGTTLHLNLGSTTEGSAALSENIGVLNGATGPADLLSGSFSLSGSSLYSNTSFGSFASLTAGSADANPTISLGTGTIGTFQETIVVHGTGSNASGYSGTLTNETIIVAGTITAAPQFIAATPSAVAPAATPMTGSDAVKAYAVQGLVGSAPTFSSASPDVTSASASTVSIGAYTSTDLISSPSHAGLHAAIIAGLG